MKLSALGILATTSGMGVNDFLAGPLAIQYGALAILGGILCYLLGWTLPSIIGAQRDQRTDFLQALESERKVSLETQDAIRHDFRDALAGVSQAVDRMAIVQSGAGRSAGQ
jgi:hypothetical protein